mmetsp:Transcript_54176/g.124759  ORF Transcript_54176/g.124759 Transcript_54176/m.124759 type:complete len:89 (+) Transcript_54176:897-1163(+)
MQRGDVLLANSTGAALFGFLGLRWELSFLSGEALRAKRPGPRCFLCEEKFPLPRASAGSPSSKEGQGAKSFLLPRSANDWVPPGEAAR